jgi:hypothetical protein
MFSSSATSRVSSFLGPSFAACFTSGLVVSDVVSFAVEDEDSRRLSSERDRERSA